MNEIKTIGIIGSGKMGSDIFNYVSDFNFKLMWFTRNSDHKEILHNTYHKKIKRQLKHGIISQEIFDIRTSFKITNNLNDLSECDLIIESIIEEQDIKIELFQALDKIVKPSCVLASNSSSILPSEISENVQRKNRILGLHFFYPMAFKNVVELISSKFTDEITIEKIKLFLGDIKRFYLEQNETSAFILNRFLLQIQIAAFNLLKENSLGYKQFDDISKQLIPEFGLFEIMDNVGHNTMYNAILNYSRMDVDKKKYELLLNELNTRKSVSDENERNLFYNDDLENKQVNHGTALEIINELKAVANEYFKKYTNEYKINVYNFKKGLEEYCGLML